MLMAVVMAFAAFVPSAAYASSGTVSVTDEVKRGQLVIYKYNAESGESVDVGGASLAGAEFTITNLSPQPVVYIDEFGHRITYAKNESWTIATKWDAALNAFVAKTPVQSLPYGDYIVKETKASPGYGLATKNNYLNHRYIPGYPDFTERDRKWVDTGYKFSIRENGQVVTFKDRNTEEKPNTDGSITENYTAGPGAYNPLIRGGIETIKRDHDLLRATPQGNATLEGGTWVVYNWNDKPVTVWDHFDQDPDGVMHGVIAEKQTYTLRNGSTITTDVDADGKVAKGGIVAVIQSGDDGRAQTFMDALPVGWYKIVEAEAPEGYVREELWQSFVLIDDDDWDTVVATDCDDPVLRGGVGIQKVDGERFDLTDMGDKLPQGDASLAGAHIRIYNNSPRDVFIYQQANDVAGVSGRIGGGQLVGEIVTNENGWAQLLQLPYGSYYAVEVDPSTGYLLNEDWRYDFTIGGNGTDREGKTVVVTNMDGDAPYANALRETVIHGNVLGAKVDGETFGHKPLGAATLEGAKIKVRNVSAERIYWNGEPYEVGATVTTLTTDENGYFEIKDLPYGSYEFTESAAPRGYIRNTEWKQVVKIREEGKTYDMTEYIEDPEEGEYSALTDLVIREDLLFQKVDSKTMKPMAGIPFLVTSNTTGEWHVFVTDEDGMLDTSAYMADDATDTDGQPQWRMHTYNTNASDAAWNGSEIDDSKLTWEQGYWFMGEDPVTEGHKVVDERSALPFDTYTIQELRCEANAGYDLVDRTVTLMRNNNVVEDIGTIDNGAYNPGDDGLTPVNGTTFYAMKSASPAAASRVNAGDTITYTIAYKNTGAEASDLKITDKVPLSTTFVSADNDGALEGDTVVWNIENVEPDASGTVTFKVKVNANPRSLVSNQAHYGKPDGPEGTTNVVQHTTDGTPVPGNLTAEKSADKPAGSEVTIGDVVTYTIKLTNMGGAAVDNIGVFDVIPDGAVLAQITDDEGYAHDAIYDDGYKANAAGIGWNVGTIAPGESKTVRFSVEVTDAAYKILANQASFGTVYGRVNCCLENSTNVIEHNVVRYPDIEVVKTDDAGGEVSNGQIVTYTITVKNNGAGNAYNVSVVDTLPECVQYVEGSVSGEHSGKGATEDDPTVSWVIPRILHSGESVELTFKGRVRDKSPLGKEIVNTVVATPENGDAAETANTVTVIDPLEGVDIAKTADPGEDANISVGDTITYTIDWTNNGTHTVNGFAVRDVIPEGTTFVEGSIVVTGADGKTSTEIEEEAQAGEAGGESGDDVPDAGEVDCDPLPVTWTPVTTVSKTDPEGIYRAVVRTDRQHFDTWPEVRAFLEKAVFPQYIEFVVTDDDWYDTAWLATVQEDGSIKLLMRLIVPSADQSANKASANGIMGNYSPSDNSVYALQTELAPGQSGKLTFQVTVNEGWEGKKISNTFTYGKNVYGAPNGDLERQGNTVEHNAGKPHLTDMVKSVSPEGAVAPGDVLHYTVEIANDGDGVARNVWVNDVLREQDLKGVIYLPGTYVVENGDPEMTELFSRILDSNSMEIPAYAAELAPGAVLKLTFDVCALDVVAGDVIENTATWTMGADDGFVPEGALDNKSNTVRNEVADPELYIEKSATPAPGLVRNGDEISYTFTIGNSGKAAANNVAVFDAVPYGTELAGGLSGLKAASDSSYVWADGISLAPGATKTFAFKVRVTGDAQADDIIANRATVGFGSAPEHALAVDSNEIVHQVMPAELLVSKTSDAQDSEFEAGDVVTYTITLESANGALARGVGFYDAIPAGMSYVEGSLSAENIEAEFSGGAVTGYAETLEAGTVATITFSASVDEGAWGDVTNIGTYGLNQTGQPSGPLPGKTNPVNGRVPAPEISETDLYIGKSASPADGNVEAGDVITYTIAVGNSSGLDASGLAVFDTVPQGTTLVEESLVGLKAAEDGKSVYMDAMGLASGKTATMSFAVTVDDEAAEGDIVSNRATAGFFEGVPTHEMNMHSNEVVHQVAGGKAVVTKSADVEDGAHVVSGDVVHYTLTANVASGNVARGVAVHDVIPEHMSLVAGSLKSQGAAANAISENGRATAISAYIGRLEKDATATIEFDLKVDEGFLGTIANTATYANGMDAAPNGPLENSTNTVSVVTSAPELKIVKYQNPKSGSIVANGDTIEYAIRVSNIGDVKARYVGIYDAAPEGTTYVAGSLTTDRGSVHEMEDGMLVNIAGDLEPGEAAVMRFKVTVDYGFYGTIKNRADWVSPAAAPGTGGANTSNETQADTDPDDPFGGGVILMRLPYTGVATIPIPDGSFTGQSNDVGDPTGKDDGYDPFAPAGEGNSSSTVPSEDGQKGDETGGNTSNEVSVIVPRPEGEPEGEPAADGEQGETGKSNEVVAEVAKPVIELVKSADPKDGSLVKPGDIVTYKLVAENKGEGNANNIMILDTVPEGLTFVEGSLSGKDCEPVLGEDGVIRAVVSLKSGEKAEISFAATVDAETVGRVANVAKWGQTPDGQADPKETTDSNEVMVVADQDAAIELVKSSKPADGSIVGVGDVVEYTLVATNVGLDATKATITDALDAGLEYIEGSASAGEFKDGVLTVETDEIAVGKSVTITFKAKVVAEAGKVVANRAAWVETGVEGAESVESNEVKLTVGEAKMALSKSNSPSDGESVGAGDVITYTMTLANTGNLAATGAVIVDKVPAHTTYVAGSAKVLDGEGQTIEGISEDSLVVREGDAVTGFVYEVGDVAANGSSGTLQFQVKVDAGYAGKVDNTAAWAQGIEEKPTKPEVPEDKKGGESNKVENDVKAAAKLSIVKSTKASAFQAGKTVEYDITVKNEGGEDAKGVKITDVPGKGLQFVKASIADKQVSASASAQPVKTTSLKSTEIATRYYWGYEPEDRTEADVKLDSVANPSYFNVAAGYRARLSVWEQGSEIARVTELSSGHATKVDLPKAGRMQVAIYGKDSSGNYSQQVYSDKLVSMDDKDASALNEANINRVSDMTWTVDVPAGQSVTVHATFNVLPIAGDTVENTGKFDWNGQSGDSVAKLGKGGSGDLPATGQVGIVFLLALLGVACGLFGMRLVRGEGAVKR